MSMSTKASVKVWNEAHEVGKATFEDWGNECRPPEVHPAAAICHNLALDA